MLRKDGRGYDKLREVKITRNFIKYAEGSCLIEVGDTKVVCTASTEEKVPSFIKGTGSGWVTAEYDMLPRACRERNIRGVTRGKPDGRSYEIQRLIGRSLRAVVDLAYLGERTIWVDCDVLQADGGTRTAGITGGFIALVSALSRLKKDRVFDKLPVEDFVAAVSCGIVKDECLLDLTFEEDSNAEVDMNVVMTGEGKFVEIQGTAENSTFDNDKLNIFLDLAKKGIKELNNIQKEVLGIDIFK